MPPACQPGSMVPPIPLIPYSSFETASTEVLNFLQSRLGFQLWMVTRTQSEEWIVLNATDQGYGVEAGNVFRWTDSFCSRMVEGLGPRIAPRSNEIAAYAGAPIGQQVEIGAYVGVPLRRTDGSLFGTLCAIDPSPMPETIADELPLVELMSRLLTTVLEYDLKAQSENRRAEHARQEAMTDKLTGLFNRRGWDALVEKEHGRCLRYGHSSCTLSIDLDGLKQINDLQGHTRGDQMLRRAAAAFKTVGRESDIVARIGGDEFAIMLVECDLARGQRIVNRLYAALATVNVAASIGIAASSISASILETFDAADKMMYQTKLARKSNQGCPTTRWPTNSGGESPLASS